MEFKERGLVCGIDEAGRGPLIGPLVLAGALIEIKKLPLLRKLGIKESKLLSPNRRDFLFNKIKNLLTAFRIKIVSPEEIDVVLADPQLNLNLLEANLSAEITQELKPDKVILDCPSNNLVAYRDYFWNQLKLPLRERIKIIVEHRADSNYLIVGAASILAKVTRDREIEKLKREFKVDFGSGYLTDEKTQKFLKENYNDSRYRKLFRKKWQPYQKLIKQEKQKRLDAFENFE